MAGKEAPIYLDAEAWRTVLIDAQFAGSIALSSLLQNLLEGKAGIPAILKG